MHTGINIDERKGYGGREGGGGQMPLSSVVYCGIRKSTLRFAIYTGLEGRRVRSLVPFVLGHDGTQSPPPLPPLVQICVGRF